MNPKFLHVLDSFMAYILSKFQAESLKLRPGGSKMQKNSSRKKTRAYLNFWAIDPKFLHVLDSFMAYILWKFQADSFKIEAWRIQNVEEFFSELKNSCWS